MNAEPSSCRQTDSVRVTDSGDCPVEALRTRVETVLRADPHLQTYSLSCHVREGTLVLRGAVSCYYHKQIAQTIAANVDGVERIINQIEVVESARS